MLDYIGFWVGILNRRNWLSTEEPTISGCAHFRLNKYISRTRFEGILGSLRYTYQKYGEYDDGLFHMFKTKETWNLNMVEAL